MATEIGTASNYKDLLDRLRLFLTGANSPSSGLTWVTERYDTGKSAASNPIAAEFTGNQTWDELIMRGNGGTSPETEIYFAIATFGNSGSGAYNWQVRGLTGYTNTSPETDYLDQPGHSPPCYVPLQNTTMNYWFIGSERRVIAIVQTGTSFQVFHAGLLNPFATDAEYPYPMLVAGSAFIPSTVFNSNDVAFSAIPDPGGNSIDTVPVGTFPNNESTAWLRFTDGNWYAVKNFRNAGNAESSLIDGPGIACVWPTADFTSGSFPAENVINTNFDFRSRYFNDNPGGNPPSELRRSFGSPELTTLWPTVILLPDGNQIAGEIDGLFWCSAQGGLTSGDTITDEGESPEVVHYVFQNVHRTDPWKYLAVRFT